MVLEDHIFQREMVDKCWHRDRRGQSRIRQILAAHQTALESETVLGGDALFLVVYGRHEFLRRNHARKGLSRQVQRQCDHIVQNQVNERRENVRGVSINEEASQLILFQRAYQAAARVVTVVDQMMQSVLNI